MSDLPLHAESTSPLPIVEAATSAPPNALAPRQAQPHSTSTECLYTWTLQSAFTLGL